MLLTLGSSKFLTLLTAILTKLTVLTESAGETFIDALLTGLTSIATKVVNFFTSLFTAVVGIIYADGAITIVGWLMIVGMAFGAFWFVFRWIRSLIRFK